MADIFTKEKRSEVMSRIRGKNTGPEKLVFKFLRARNIYFQRHYKRAPGCPDIALPRKKRAVFIDGDFWHGHNFAERKARMTGENAEFWIAKIERNMDRDARTAAELAERGWQVLRIWEHRLKTKKFRAEAMEEIVGFLTS